MAMRKFATEFIRYSKDLSLTPRWKIGNWEKFYSVYPANYVRPVCKKEDQGILEKENKLSELAHIPIRPAFSCESSSEFYDPIISKFINFIMKDGRKVLARELLNKTFENIKRIQTEKYHKSDLEKKDTIELDPKIVFKKAFENARPCLQLIIMRRGGQNYNIPVPINAKRSDFLGMNWLLEAARGREDRKILLPTQLAYELIDASNNVGKVIRRKQEVYRQCEANRSYAHFRWT